MTEKAKMQQQQEREDLISRSTLFSGKIFSVEREEHSTRTYDLVKHKQAVAILPIDSKGNVILIQQYRRPPDEILIEIPAGLMEKDEEIEACAERELQEEIGYRANTLIPIGSFYTSPGFCDELVHIFIAKDLVESKLPHDEHEMIDLYIVSKKEIVKLLESKQIRDMKTQLALSYYLCCVKEIEH